MNKQHSKTYPVHFDGFVWVEVDIDDLKQLGIAGLISRGSRRDGDRVFLIDYDWGFYAGAVERVCGLPPNTFKPALADQDCHLPNFINRLPAYVPD